MRAFLLLLLLLIGSTLPLGAQDLSKCHVGPDNPCSPCETFFWFIGLSRQDEEGLIIETADIRPQLISEDQHEEYEVELPSPWANIVFDFTTRAEQVGYGDLPEIEKQAEWLNMWNAAVRYAVYMGRARDLELQQRQILEAAMLPQADMTCYFPRMWVLAGADTLGWMGFDDWMAADTITMPPVRFEFILESVHKPSGGGGVGIPGIRKR